MNGACPDHPGEYHRNNYDPRQPDFVNRQNGQVNRNGSYGVCEQCDPRSGTCSYHREHPGTYRVVSK